MTCGVIAKKTTIGGTHRSVRRFDVAHQEKPLTHVDCTGGIACIGMVRMVSVMIVETTEQDFLFVGLIIAVGVRKENHISPLRYVNTFRSEFESHGQVQSVCKYGLFVCLSIIVGILQYQQLIRWL